CSRLAPHGWSTGADGEGTPAPWGLSGGAVRRIRTKARAQRRATWPHACRNSGLLVARGSSLVAIRRSRHRVAGFSGISLALCVQASTAHACQGLGRRPGSPHPNGSSPLAACPAQRYRGKRSLQVATPHSPSMRLRSLFAGTGTKREAIFLSRFIGVRSDGTNPRHSVSARYL